MKKYRIPRKIKKRLKRLEQLTFCSDENINKLMDGLNLKYRELPLMLPVLTLEFIDAFKKIYDIK